MERIVTISRNMSTYLEISLCLISNPRSSGFAVAALECITSLKK